MPRGVVHKEGEENMRNCKTLIKKIDGLQKGEVIEINAINLSEKGIYVLRDYIKRGVIKPVESELKKSIVTSEIPNFMAGKSICPQTAYVKV